MLEVKKALLAEAAKECHIADLMDDVGLDYEEADEIVNEYANPETMEELGDLLFETANDFFNRKFKELEENGC